MNLTFDTVAMAKKESEKDQRASDRISIPGATVLLRKHSVLNIFERYSRPMALYNFTKSGICFVSDKPFSLGDKITVQIVIPGEKTLRLVGQIRWIEFGEGPEERIIGAQFRAFGKGSDFNPLKSLDQLRSLQQKFS